MEVLAKFMLHRDESLLGSSIGRDDALLVWLRVVLSQVAEPNMSSRHYYEPLTFHSRLSSQLGRGPRTRT